MSEKITRKDRERLATVCQPGNYFSYPGPHNDWVPRLLAALDAADKLRKRIASYHSDCQRKGEDEDCTGCALIAEYDALVEHTT